MKPIELYIGLDVHKDSTTVAVAVPGLKGEIRLFGSISSGQPFENDHIDTNRGPVFLTLEG
jgi:hypothetical protein